MDDGSWSQVHICSLTPGDKVTLLGRELTVGFCVPAPRGGDFYILEAYGDDLQDIISCTLDKNTPISAQKNTFI